MKFIRWCRPAQTANHVRKTTTQLLTDPEEAGAMVRDGCLVAFPTETVYGLGASIERPDAVARIFRAKGRPSDNPLIVHIAHRREVRALASEVPPSARRLMAAFWPGPLTVILKKAENVSPKVTANLDTVAIRMPSHPVARAFLRAAGVPVAAPSANRSGRPSPTTWEAVWEDLCGRIDAILIGPPSEVGLESTVVDCTGAVPVILRPGAITRRMIEAVVPGTRYAGHKERAEGRSPGLRHRHYAPQARVVLAAWPKAPVQAMGRAAWIGIGRPPDGIAKAKRCRSVAEYARTLFDFFRTCDREGIEVIYCQPVRPRGLGVALMDRLRRAASATAE